MKVQQPSQPQQYSHQEEEQSHWWTKPLDQIQSVTRKIFHRRNKTHLNVNVHESYGKERLQVVSTVSPATAVPASTPLPTATSPSFKKLQASLSLKSSFPEKIPGSSNVNNNTCTSFWWSHEQSMILLVLLMAIVALSVLAQYVFFSPKNKQASPRPHMTRTNSAGKTRSLTVTTATASNATSLGDDQVTTLEQARAKIAQLQAQVDDYKRQLKTCTQKKHPETELPTPTVTPHSPIDTAIARDSDGSDHQDNNNNNNNNKKDDYQAHMIQQLRHELNEKKSQLEALQVSLYLENKQYASHASVQHDLDLLKASQAEKQQLSARLQNTQELVMEQQQQLEALKRLRQTDLAVIASFQQQER